MTDTPIPEGGTEVPPEALLQIIGEQLVQIRVLQSRLAQYANQSVQSEQAGNGKLSTSPENSALFDGRMSKEVPRQTGQR